jgi:hypothetical protein
MKKTVKLLTVILALGLMFGACKKDEEPAAKGSKGNKSVIASEKGVYLASEFDKDATYIYDVTHDVTTFNPITTLGNPSFYNIFAKKVETGELYSSFCANVGSHAFGGAVYKVRTEDFIAEKGEQLYDNILKALNYVYDNYDGLDVWVTDPGTYANKTIAGMVIHAILDNLTENTMPGGEWGPHDAYNPTVNAAVADVLKNYHTATIGSVTEFVVLAGPNYPADILDCQPQIIPLVGEPEEDCYTYFHSAEFDLILAEFTAFEADPVLAHDMAVDYVLMNLHKEWWVEGSCEPYHDFDCDHWIAEYKKLVAAGHYDDTDLCHIWLKKLADSCRVLGPAYGSVTATNAGNVPSILAKLDPKNGNVIYKGKTDPANTPWVVANSNHFTFAAFTTMEAINGVELDMVVGNKFQIVGKAFVQKVGNNLVIEIENFGTGSFGAMAFLNDTQAKNFPKNGNIHSQKEADLKKELLSTTGFDHNNKLIVPCPVSANANGLIYLYIHCGTIQFWQ